MSQVLQINLIVFTALTFLIVIMMIRNNRLELKYALAWLVTALVLLAFSILPHTVSVLSSFLGIATDVNTVFLVMIFFLFMIDFSLTVALSRQSVINKRLVQEIALIQYHIRNKENALITSDEEQNTK